VENFVITGIDKNNSQNKPCKIKKSRENFFSSKRKENKMKKKVISGVNCIFNFIPVKYPDVLWSKRGVRWHQEV